MPDANPCRDAVGGFQAGSGASSVMGLGELVGLSWGAR